MDMFLFLFIWVFLAVAIAVSGGKYLAKGTEYKIEARMMIGISTVALCILSYLFYLDGLSFGIGHPMTFARIFLNR